MTSNPPTRFNVDQLRPLLQWLYTGHSLLQAPPLATLAPGFLAHFPSDMAIEQLAHALNQQADRRLGVLFERLVACAINAQPDYRVVACNVPVRADRTLGELDLLVRDPRDRLIHMEVCLKFYLGVSDHLWPGPDPRDTLDQKVQHLAAHQFPVGQSSAASDILASQGWGKLDEQWLLTRGRLFYPGEGALAPPASALPGHERGLWWHCHGLPRRGHWHPLEKWQWPHCLHSFAQASLAPEPWLDSPAAVDHVCRLNRPVMMLWQPGDGLPPEAVFVVPDSWPNSPTR